MLNDPLKIETGYISGVVLGDVGNEVRMYRGIPYAAPPVGGLRWRPPQPAASWSGIRECTQWTGRSPQGNRAGLGEQSEDCLYLNLLTPAKGETDRLPVMVWFHGGGLSILSANSLTYCNTALPQHGVIVVTVNHRLGPLGYMAHPSLSAESDKKVSGNYGTLDLIAALKWVQRNIKAFGGDPDNVLIFGESGGGTKVLSCMSSPLAKGLFHRASIQSGSAACSPNRGVSLEDAERMGDRVAEKLGVKGETDVLAALRSKSWEEILAATSDRDMGYRAALTVDGWVLPDSVYNIFLEGKQNDVPYFVGANEGENSFESVARCAGMNTGKSKAYAYVFSHVAARWKKEGVVAFHGSELPYVFGYIDGLKAPVTSGLSRRGGAKQPDPGANEIDDAVAESMMTIWSHFAKTGDPNIEGLVTWPPYNHETDQYLDIGSTLQVKTGIKNAYIAPPE